MPFPPRRIIDASSPDNCRVLSDHRMDEKQTMSSLTQGSLALVKRCLWLEQEPCVVALCRALLCIFTVNGITKNISEDILKREALR